MARRASKVGSILLLISSIVTYVAAVVIFIASIVAGVYFRNQFIQAPFIPLVGIVVAIVIGFVGYLKLYLSRMMKVPKKTLTAGIISLIIGLLGGFDILSIIGGIFGIVEGAD